jgi:hypothetical protein
MRTSFQREIHKGQAKQIALNAVVFVGAGINSTTRYSKILDPSETRSSAANPKMHNAEKLKSFRNAYECSVDMLNGN